MLTASAIESVKDWKYKPYRLKGKLVQIETVITVNYKIADSER
jgi:outer membrane biosynthesis protein TonB